MFIRDRSKLDATDATDASQIRFLICHDVLRYTLMGMHHQDETWSESQVCLRAVLEDIERERDTS